MNRIRTQRLPLPVVIAIAFVGSWCLVALIALAVMWLLRAAGALL